MLAGYTTQAGVPALPARGQQLFTIRHGGEWSCASCHGAVPTQTGKHSLLGTIDGCDRATRLVEQLLTLSRLEATAAPSMTAVDLSALSRQVVADLAPKAVGKKTLEFEAAEPCRIPGNEILLGVLVRNLLDNAVRYSPPSGRIKVAVELQYGQVVLIVEDSGPGLDEAERQRLGERFFRVMGNLESGSGLGWSIVRRIAAVHQMDVQVAA
jgi:two-component system sensor histidine kinase QseC